MELPVIVAELAMTSKAAPESWGHRVCTSGLVLVSAAIHPTPGRLILMGARRRLISNSYPSATEWRSRWRARPVPTARTGRNDRQPYLVERTANGSPAERNTGCCGPSRRLASTASAPTAHSCTVCGTTFATELANANVRVYTLMKLLGHESMVTSQRNAVLTAPAPTPDPLLTQPPLRHPHHKR
jgi:hypothetical protein